MTDVATAPQTTPPTTGWPALTEELDAWATAGRTATFWWRDDDAQQPGPRLDRLLDLSIRHRVPVTLAVIPAGASAGLREMLAQTAAGTANVTVVQHGYAHQNHATPAEKKVELGGHRPAQHVIAELAVGRQTLDGWPNAVPLLVPPWNRIAPHLVPLLPSLGFTGLSTFGPRGGTTQPATRDRELTVINSHIDPIAWRHRVDPGPPPFTGLDAALAAAVGHLRQRRLGPVDPGEPTGLLTHHRDHHDDVWRFIEAFLSRTLAHPAVRWLGLQEAFHQ